MFENLSERFTKIFERPSPVVSCNVGVIEAMSPPGFFDGYFIVKNTGGGNLEGDIFARSSFINLLTQTIEGNDVIIEYEIDLRHLSPGETFFSQIVLTTSGGQLVIPVNIGIEQYYVKCGRYKIHTLYEFVNCARAMPKEAAELFASEEFSEWLLNTNCGHIEFYRKITENSAGVREMDSFLTACGLKEKAALSPLTKNIEITVALGDGTVTGYAELTRVSWGELYYSVYTESNCRWLRIIKSAITSADFSEDRLDYPFLIDSEILNGGKSSETLIFESKQGIIKVPVTVVKPKLFTVKTSRLSYKSDDSGFLVCENHTGVNAIVEVDSSESFVRFKASKYVVDNIAEIPFEIKVNSFLNLGIGKKPVNISNIHLRTVIDGRVYKETVTIKAGSLLRV